MNQTQQSMSDQQQRQDDPYEDFNEYNHAYDLEVIYSIIYYSLN